MRTTYNYRFKRNTVLISLVIFLVVYVCFIGNQTSHQFISPKVLVKGEAKDPFRFKLPHAWAWNDDVIYIEKQDVLVNKETLEKLGNDSIENKNTSYRNPSVDSDYGQNRYMGVEGVEDYILSRDDYREPRKPINTRIQKCTHPLNNILLLKTHHTGSDVITNILNRYADLRDLKVAIPSGGVSTFFWPARFNWRHLDLSLVDGILPNILCNHARYNPDVMAQIMPPGTAYVTMLRHPLSNFEAIFRNEDFAGLLDMYEFADPVGAFLENPKYYIQRIIKRNTFKDTLNLIKNGMFFDLGLRTADYHKPDIVKDAILDIDEKFIVVLIYEYLDESLVLMKRKLCWELDDVLYLKTLLNKDESTKRYTKYEMESLQKWSKADFSLYEHFNATLWKTISYEKDFYQELNIFKEKQKEIEQDCSEYLYVTESRKSEARNMESREEHSQDAQSRDVMSHDISSRNSELYDTVSHNVGSRNLMSYDDDPLQIPSHNMESRNTESHNFRTHNDESHNFMSQDAQPLDIPSHNEESRNENSRNGVSRGVRSRDGGSTIPRMNQYLCHKMSISTARYLEYFRTKFASDKH